MRNIRLRKKALSVAAATVLTISGATAPIGSKTLLLSETGTVTSAAAESSVKFLNTVGYDEAMYATWSSVNGASGYNVYVDGVKLDNMLIRQYKGYMRADALGMKSGSHKLKVVPVINGQEDNSKSAETTASAYANDRSGFGFVNGTSSGAYNEDGTLKSNAKVIYITNSTKDTVTASFPNKDGKDTTFTGIQNIITGLKSNKKVGPVVLRFIGNIEDPANMPKGDLYVDGVTCGLTIEGIGNDTTFNGFGLVLKGCSNVEVRNLGFMNCNSSETDDCGLQQANDHVWVHNCDFFYGDAGSDADQKKGDGALDTKKSTYITHSYNHFWDNGKCNLQGMKDETTSNYVTYHHNWYDHSDSRHPRIRTCTVHVYNNYFDGNAKYGIGAALGCSVFVENNYFRNCAKPMIIASQASDLDSEGKSIMSGESGGIIKSFGNYMTGQKSYVTYQQNNTDFDAYEASSRNEKVPSGVAAKSGGSVYSNFDTDASLMYNYSPDKPEDVPAKVTAYAGRVDGGDFKWKFDNSVDDASYAVNEALKSALVSYKDSITAIGSGFKQDDSEPPVVTTEPVVTDIPVTTQTEIVTTTASDPEIDVPITGGDVIYASPDGNGDGKSVDSPTNVIKAINAVKPGGYIYLLGGTYSFTETIDIAESNSGTEGKYKTIAAYPNAEVKFDFTGQVVDASARGFVLEGSYWHFYGFEICNAGDNGMLLAGDNNIIEKMVFNGNQDTGLQVSRLNGSYNSISQWPSYNLIKNCTSKNNCDDKTMENADGFAAKLTCGEGNVFDGCMSYNNSDDGWDLYAKDATGPIGVVTIKNCIAFRNGFTESGKGYGGCDGNGFKLGGGGVGTRHIVENCLAFENLNCGFTDNNNPKFGDMKLCTAYNNGIGGNGKANYFVYRNDTSSTLTNMMSYYNTGKVSKTNAAGIKLASDKFVGNMTSSVYFNNNGSYYYITGTTAIASGEKKGTVVSPSESDFISLNVPAMGTDFHKVWRNADGSPKPSGFAETALNGSFSGLGYKMSSGVSQTATPDPYAHNTDPDIPPTTEPVTQPVTAEAGKKGDANCDNEVDMSDVVMVMQACLNPMKYGIDGTSEDRITHDGEINGNVDGNEALTPNDALIIQKFTLNLITSF